MDENGSFNISSIFWENFNEELSQTNEDLRKLSTQNTLFQMSDFDEEIKNQIMQKEINDNKGNLINENEEKKLSNNEKKNDNNNNENRNDNSNNENKNDNNNENIQIYIKKKRNTKQKEDIPRNDNIFKQVKIQAIKFIINTLNKLLNNHVYNFKNNIKKELKDRVMKDYNNKILNESIENLLTNNHYCDDNHNKKIIKYFEDIYKKNEGDKNLKLIKILLKKKLIEIIEIFGMDENRFEREYGFKNQYLLEKNLSIKNNIYVKNLINFGVIDFLKAKTGRKSKSNNSK